MANIESRLQRLEQKRRSDEGTIFVIDVTGLSPEQQAAKITEFEKIMGTGILVVIIDK